MKKTTTSLLAGLLLATAAYPQSPDSLQPPGSGDAIQFDGVDDKLAVGGSSAISGTFTVELWVKPADLARVPGFLGSRTPNDYAFGIQLLGGNQIHAVIGNGSSWATTSADAPCPSTAGSWICLACVVTPTNYAVYVNGQPAGSNTYSPTVPVLRDANHQLFIGWSGFGSEFFKGEIAQVRIWNVALKPRRIANIWHRILPLPQKGLVAWYCFNEGGGSLVHDASGNGNDGVLQNGPMWVRAGLPSLRPASSDELVFREVRYAGKLSDNEARFVVDIDGQSTGKGEATVELFAGDVALLPAKLPEQLKIVREGNRYFLTAAHPGRFKFKLELVAKVQRTEPWNGVSFTGPAATIASVVAQAGGTNTEVQLLNGTLLEAARTNGVSRVSGFLRADRTVALKWQGKITEVARKTLLTVDSVLAAQITPTDIKYTSRFHYDVVQGNAPRLTLALPAAQAITRLAGDQIRDWQLKPEGDRQLLVIEFIKPIEKAYDLTVYSEQSVEGADARASLNPPQPLAVERESGGLAISSEDTLVETDSLAGLRRVNAAEGALAAYRFNGRPFTLALRLKRIEPVITVADRIGARLEETRLLVSHHLALTVEKAGLYALELVLPAGFVAAEVRGEGVEDWKVADGKLQVSFPVRVLGARTLDIQLEQALKVFPEQIVIAPLRVISAAKETAQIGAASSPGIRLKTAELSGLREIPVNRLADRTDEILAFAAEQPDWTLSLAGERLAARVAADVFNLVTIGNGVAGGSATIRYGFVNQGVQELKVKLPAYCKNVDFTGPNIRRKEMVSGARGTRPSETDTNDVVWTIGLQDKAWGGYTLVVTYDYQFDPRGATLPVGGIHALNVEHETGSIAITTAASLKLSPQPAGESLHRVDETELAAADRALITRSVVLAWQYTGDQYDLAVGVQRYEELPVLAAVADRTEITSVLTEAGEMLTQASFMVKNSDKQFQRFQLPPDATLWGCYLNGQPAKAERDGEWVLVSLPHGANRDEAFAVDIVYAQTNAPLKSAWARTLQLSAPRTDVPNTYAEWQLYVPASQRLSGFGGTMKVAQGVTYGWFDAWREFLTFYGQVLNEAGAALMGFGVLAFLTVALVVSAVRRGWNGLITMLVVIAVIAILGAMLLPALSKAKIKSQSVSALSNLRQIGAAAQMFAGDNGGRLPLSYEEMTNYLRGDTLTVDPVTGTSFTYLGAGLQLHELKPESVLAYSLVNNGRCSAVFADGHSEMMSAGRFTELSQRGLVQRMSPVELGQQLQADAISRSQFRRTGGGGGDRVATGYAAPGRTPARATVPELAAPPVPPADVSVATNGFSGSVDVVGYVPAPGSSPAPMAAGIRSIRIEIPRTGQPFVFTKVLNVGNSALSIRATTMSLAAFQRLQTAGQVLGFLLGLGLGWWQWQRREPNSFLLTLALTLVIVSMASLLIEWRALHGVLIAGLPAVLLALTAWLIWKYWPRRSKPAEAMPEPNLPGPAGSLPPVVATLALLLMLGLANARAADSAIDPVSIVSASYTGTVNDRVAQVEATLQLSSAKPDQTILLFGDEVAVQQFTVKSGDAKLVRDNHDIAVRLGRRGDAVVQIKMLVKPGGDVTKRRLTFGIPPALTSRVALVLDQPEADVDFPAAISFRRVLDQDRTRVEAVLGSADRVELLWTPRVKRAAEVAATVFCQNAALVTIADGVVNVRAMLDYQVTQGELRQVRVQLPAGQRLLRVEGDSIRTWEIKEAGGQPMLIVELLRGISPAYRLTVETEQMLEALPATVKVETPHAVDVKRETGLVALCGGEELELAVDSAQELQRVDAGEFLRTGAPKTGDLVSAFRFLKPDFDLRTRVEMVQPQIEAVVRNHVRLGAESAVISAVVDYTIKRAGVFALKVVLPAGCRVDQVTGSNVLQWTERSGDGARLLDVTLKERTIGAYTLRLELVKNFKELPPAVAIEGVHPLGTVKLSGFVSVAAEPGVAVKTGSFDGLTEIPASSLPADAAAGGTGNVLAYKFVAPEPKPVPGWKLVVATDAVEPWVRAEIVNTFTLTETLISGRALVHYDIQNAPVKTLCVKVPASFKNVEISGSGIRSREQKDGRWCIELQNKTRGDYTLAVTWEQPRSAKTSPVEPAGISADGVERETGLLVIVAKPPLQVAEQRAQELQRVDTRDLPEWAGRPDDAAVLAYRYVRPGYALALEARRFDEAEVLQALVDDVRLTTVVADDGQMMTEMTLAVRNNGRQFLEVELPASAQVWSAFVAGQPVRTSRRDGKLLLPLEQSGADEAPVAVALTYVDTNSFPKGRGRVGFVSPRLDVPLKNARWELFLPPDYRYSDFSGTMTRELAGGNLISSFSLSEYTEKERVTKAAAIADAKKDVSGAWRNLEQGNLREASADYNRAKVKGAAGGESDEARRLEKQLRTAQASNLIQAQSAFSFNNSGQLPNQSPAFDLGVANQPVQAYDNESAEAQWTKLQQAQEIAAGQLQPLRVNLPTRGRSYTFTQVLQTEVNRPLTIQLRAANTRTGSWPDSIGLSLAGFLALWGLVAATARAARRQPASAVAASPVN